MIRNFVPFDEFAHIFVIGNDARNIDVQKPRPPPLQQVVQTMAFFGHQQQQTRGTVAVVQLPVHFVFRRQRLERFPQNRTHAFRRVRREHNAHKEQTAEFVAELRGFFDKAAFRRDFGKNTRGNARSVGTAEG